MRAFQKLASHTWPVVALGVIVAGAVPSYALAATSTQPRLAGMAEIDALRLDNLPDALAAEIHGEGIFLMLFIPSIIKFLAANGVRLIVINRTIAILKASSAIQSLSLAIDTSSLAGWEAGRRQSIRQFGIDPGKRPTRTNISRAYYNIALKVVGSLR